MISTLIVAASFDPPPFRHHRYRCRYRRPVPGAASSRAYRYCCLHPCLYPDRCQSRFGFVPSGSNRRGAAYRCVSRSLWCRSPSAAENASGCGAAWSGRVCGCRRRRKNGSPTVTAKGSVIAAARRKGRRRCRRRLRPTFWRRLLPMGSLFRRNARRCWRRYRCCRRHRYHRPRCFGSIETAAREFRKKGRFLHCTFHLFLFVPIQLFLFSHARSPTPGGLRMFSDRTDRPKWQIDPCLATKGSL